MGNRRAKRRRLWAGRYMVSRPKLQETGSIAAGTWFLSKPASGDPCPDAYGSPSIPASRSWFPDSFRLQPSVFSLRPSSSANFRLWIAAFRLPAGHHRSRVRKNVGARQFSGSLSLSTFRSPVSRRVGPCVRTALMPRIFDFRLSQNATC
jgi:hypothetical protein